MQEKIERAILIGLNSDIFSENETSTDETLEELEALLETAGGECVMKVLQNLKTPSPRTFIGSGKLEEILELAEELNADMLVFDNELSPSQIRNIQDTTNLSVLDRSNLILDIFAKRATSLEGKLQVELAQYKYILPRLVGLGKSMSRLAGGIGTRGPGESKLESDRRHIRRRIDKINEDLKEVTKNRQTNRRSREKSEIPLVSIVGYTNAGKSTLLNTLANANIHANDRLFDTLDTTIRIMKVSETLDIYLSDTVGFIRKLPHHLVNAFKATLEELASADLLIHVVDVSNEAYKTHIEVVNDVIGKLNASSRPQIIVYNKSDKLDHKIELSENEVCISAKTGEGTDTLLKLISKTLEGTLHLLTIVIPFCDGYVIDNLHKSSDLEILDYTEEGTLIKVTCDDKVYASLVKYIPEN